MGRSHRRHVRAIVMVGTAMLENMNPALTKLAECTGLIIRIVGFIFRTVARKPRFPADCSNWSLFRGSRKNRQQIIAASAIRGAIVAGFGVFCAGANALPISAVPVCARWGRRLR